jgi:hypothetical protein
VRLFYGNNKKEVLSDLMDDKVFIRRVVVLTTYQTLECSYRQEVNKTKVQCEWCGRLFQKSKLHYHQTYFCGPEAQRTEKQMKAQRKADYKDSCTALEKIAATCRLQFTIFSHHSAFQSAFTTCHHLLVCALSSSQPKG